MNISYVVWNPLRLALCVLTLCSLNQEPLYAQEGQRRLALVIGNDDYEGLASLNNGVADAELIAETMQSIGVDSVVFHANLDRSGMEAAFSRFFQEMLGFDVGVIYYAGHGMQDEFGDGFLIPVDFPANQGQSALFDYAYPLDRVLRRMRNVESKSFVAFLDACRNNPYSAGSRSAGSGLASPQVPSEGVIVGYSTMAGSVAGDYSESANGVYAQSLSSALNRPNVPIETLLKEVGAETRRTSQGEQNPEWWGNISGVVFLHSDPTKYEVTLMEGQDAIIERIGAVWAWENVDDFWYQFNQGTVSVPDWALGDASQLRFIAESHRLKGLDAFALEADLFRLWLSFVDGMVNRGSVLNIDSLSGRSLGLDFDFKSAYPNQERFCRVFALESELEFELFVNYLLLTVDSYSPLRLERISQVVDLLESVGNPILKVMGNTWLRVIATMHGGYEENNEILMRPKKFPFIFLDGVVASVWKESKAWEEGLRPGCVFREKLEQSEYSERWLVWSEDESREFEVTLEVGSYIIQSDGDGLRVPSNSELLRVFDLNLGVFVEGEMEEMKWVLGQSQSCADYMRIFPGQGIYPTAFNISQMSWYSCSNLGVDPQTPGWELRLSLLKNTRRVIEAMYEQGLGDSKLSIVLFRRLGLDINSLNVWLSGESRVGDDEVNWRKVKKELIALHEIYRDLLSSWSGYSGTVDPAFSHLGGYSIAGKVYEYGSAVYNTDKHCSYSHDELELVDDLIESMDNEWYYAGSEVDTYFLNYAGAKCIRNISLFPDSTAEYVTDVISLLTDSIYHGPEYDVNRLYEASPFIGFVSSVDWSLVSDREKIQVLEGLCKMNAQLSCGYARPVYWGLRICQSMEIDSLSRSDALRLERALFLLLDTFLLCNSNNDEGENWVNFREELDALKAKSTAGYWLEDWEQWEDYFKYRFE